MDSALSFLTCPFPVAAVSDTATIIEANHEWQAIAPLSSNAGTALQLQAPDSDALEMLIQLVSIELQPNWIDVEAHALKEKHWARCHVWCAEDGTLWLAVVPLRALRDIELSRVEIEHIESVLEHTADAIAIVGHDMSLRFASGIATRWLGMSGSAYEGKNALSFVYPDDHAVLLESFADCITTPRRSLKARFRAIHNDGSLIWVEGIGTNMFDDPAIEGILVTLNDITELVESRTAAQANKDALELEKQRYETLAKFTPTGVFELNEANELTYRNERFDELLGIDQPDDFSWELFDPRDRPTLDTALARTRAGDTAQETVRLAAPRPDGQQMWITLRAAQHGEGRILASLEDATNQVVTQAELAHRADHDVLTGLPNRESLLVQLDALNATEQIAVLFLDIDNFKDINDGLGHQTGDLVLTEIAKRIIAVVRPGDIVGRLHGDEFLVICRQASDVALAHDIAARVVASVNRPMTVGAQQLLVSGSIGIAINSDPQHPNVTSEQLLAAADAAMYEAKRRGGSRSVPYNDELGKRIADRLRLHGDIQRAGELGELELHYQPIVDLGNGQAVRSEALVRWHHPAQGFILPERFIPEIEKTELMDRLGMWIFEQVLIDLQELRSRDGETLPVNVNVSPRQLSDGSFAASALALLDRYQIPGEMVTIEITELVRMGDFAPVERQLHELRDRGVSVAVDDFGTGFSALAYLRRFPFDQVKIDGVFVDQIDTSGTDQAIVGAMIEVATSLNAAAIAEKVERQSQVDTLIKLGCSYAQGYLLGDPRPLERMP